MHNFTDYFLKMIDVITRSINEIHQKTSTFWTTFWSKGQQHFTFLDKLFNGIMLIPLGYKLILGTAIWKGLPRETRIYVPIGTQQKITWKEFEGWSACPSTHWTGESHQRIEWSRSLSSDFPEDLKSKKTPLGPSVLRAQFCVPSA